MSLRKARSESIHFDSVSPGLTAAERAEVLAQQQADAKVVSDNQYTAESAAGMSA